MVPYELQQSISLQIMQVRGYTGNRQENCEFRFLELGVWIVNDGALKKSDILNSLCRVKSDILNSLPREYEKAVSPDFLRQETECLVWS